MIKKIFCTALISVSFSTFSSSLSNETLARQCYTISQKLEYLKKTAQTNYSTCEKLISEAALKAEASGKYIMANDKFLLESVMTKAMHALIYAESIGCEREGKLNVLQNELMQIKSHFLTE